VLIVCTGTGTEVGKTWVGAATLRALAARGVPVQARKPVQSYDPAGGATDADVLAAATGEAPTSVCPPHRWLAVPVAPPMAAARLGLPPFTIADLAREMAAEPAPPRGVRWVEGAGGPRSPLAADGDTIDLCTALAPDLVVLVADAGLGTINATRLCAAVLDRWPLAVVLNRYDPANSLHCENHDWLRARAGLDVVTATDHLATLVADRGDTITSPARHTRR
jgi:dethiobiotin synthetase